MAVWRILQTGSFLGKNGRKTGTFSAKKRAENGRNKNFSRKKTGALKFCFSFFLAVFTVLQVHPKTRLSITWPRERLLLWFMRFTTYRGELTLNVDKVTKNSRFSQNARLNGHASFKTSYFSTLPKQPPPWPQSSFSFVRFYFQDTVITITMNNIYVCWRLQWTNILT